VDPEALYDHFLAGEAEATPDHLAYLDRGIDGAPLQPQIPEFPSRLYKLHPPAGYPDVGVKPAIADSGLEFLHPAITEACVATPAGWFGRRALEPVQMWSATKVFPMAKLVSTVPPQVSLEDCTLESPDGSQSMTVGGAFDAIVSYRQGVGTSNALARTLKHFDTPESLERWVENLTGNEALTFRGGYGDAAWIADPLLKQPGNPEPLLQGSGAEHRGDNLVSAYDLCRAFGELGWKSRTPGFDPLIRALGTDSARYVDVALEAMGLNSRVQDLVVISKLGFGYSELRGRWEDVYSAFVSFRDKQTGQDVQLSLALRAVQGPDSDRAAMELDARMATEVARIVDKALQGPWEATAKSAPRACSAGR
jgi:hypothetical protein